MAERRFGIGADQILVVESSKSADCRMLIYNADGSQVEMCGNGIRCVAEFLRREKNLPSDLRLSVETIAGVREVAFRGNLIDVDMGAPIFSPRGIPMEMEGADVIKRDITVSDKTFQITALSMGNPHCIVLVDDCESFPLAFYGPLFEKHPLFPKRTNFECVEIIDGKTIRTRVWERGVGITLACGTGACASYVAACLAGRTESAGTVILDGGRLEIEWPTENNHVTMRGPAQIVFEGVYYL